MTLKTFLFSTVSDSAHHLLSFRGDCFCIAPLYRSIKLKPIFWGPKTSFRDLTYGYFWLSAVEWCIFAHLSKKEWYILQPFSVPCIRKKMPFEKPKESFSVTIYLCYLESVIFRLSSSQYGTTWNVYVPISFHLYGSVSWVDLLVTAW